MVGEGSNRKYEEGLTLCDDSTAQAMKRSITKRFIPYTGSSSGEHSFMHMRYALIGIVVFSSLLLGGCQAPPRSWSELKTGALASAQARHPHAVLFYSSVSSKKQDGVLVESKEFTFFTQDGTSFCVGHTTVTYYACKNATITLRPFDYAWVKSVSDRLMLQSLDYHEAFAICQRYFPEAPTDDARSFNRSASLNLPDDTAKGGVWGVHLEVPGDNWSISSRYCFIDAETGAILSTKDSSTLFPTATPVP